MTERFSVVSEPLLRALASIPGVQCWWSVGPIEGYPLVKVAFNSSHGNFASTELAVRIADVLPGPALLTVTLHASIGETLRMPLLTERLGRRAEIFLEVAPEQVELVARTIATLGEEQ